MSKVLQKLTVTLLTLTALFMATTQLAPPAKAEYWTPFQLCVAECVGGCLVLIEVPPAYVECVVLCSSAECLPLAIANPASG